MFPVSVLCWDGTIIECVYDRAVDCKTVSGGCCVMNVFVLIIAPAMQPIYSLLFLTWFIVLWSAGSPILHATPGCSHQPGPAHKHRILGLGEIDLYLNRLPCFVHTYHSEPVIGSISALSSWHFIWWHTHFLHQTRGNQAACLKKVCFKNSAARPQWDLCDVISPVEGEWSH